MTEPKKETPVVIEAPAQPPAPAVVVEAESARSTRDVLLIIGAIGAVVGNVVVLAGGIYFNAKIEASKEQAAQVAVDADKKLDVIHEQTNSNLTGVNERLERAYTKIETLEKLLKAEQDPEEKDLCTLMKSKLSFSGPSGISKATSWRWALAM